MVSANPIKIHFDINSVDRAHEASINILLKAFLDDMPQRERALKYGARAEEFSLCGDLRNSDYYLLPMNWAFYESNHLVNRAVEEVNRAKNANKLVIVFNPGDFPANLPFSGAIVLESSGYYSRKETGGNTILGLPAFSGDYLAAYCNHEIIHPARKDKPLVGFCGQASKSYLQYFYRETRRRFRQALFLLNLRQSEPPPFEPTKFRGDILNTLSKSKLVDTNFVLRNKYRAGYQASKKNSRHPSRLEFIRNILETEYTVCIRGTGNYSARFYETLSLGRIPVFVNTDCLLPFADQIPFKDHFVWVEQAEISFIDGKIKDFHNRFTDEGLCDVRRKCREIWETFFSPNGYFRTLAYYLREGSSRSSYGENL